LAASLGAAAAAASKVLGSELKDAKVNDQATAALKATQTISGSLVDVIKEYAETSDRGLAGNKLTKAKPALTQLQDAMKKLLEGIASAATAAIGDRETQAALGKAAAEAEVAANKISRLLKMLTQRALPPAE